MGPRQALCHSIVEVAVGRVTNGALAQKHIDLDGSHLRREQSHLPRKAVLRHRFDWPFASNVGQRACGFRSVHG